MPNNSSSSDVHVRTALPEVRFSALLITLFTGFTGLIYEVTWHRYLANLLGSQARAAAIILAVFLGGLSVGYALFGKLSRGRSGRRLLAYCGWVEIGIGIWALAFPGFYQVLWSSIGVLSPAGGASLIFDVLVAVILIGVPTVLMGGTLPLLTQGLSAGLEDASPLHARIYAVNTGGAFLGCLLAGFWLLPQLGLTSTIYLAAPINLAAGIFLLALSRRLSTEVHPEEVISTEEIEPHRHLSMGAAVSIAFLAGFYSISLQVVFMRSVGLAAGSSEYSFSMVVAAFILMLALGAWRIAGKRGRTIPIWLNQIILCAGAIAVYLTVPNWPYYAHVIRTLFTSVSPAFYPYHLTLFVLLCLVLALPVGVMGSTLPLLFGVVKSRFSELGTVVGRLYAWNTAGCVIGALVGGYWLFYFLNLDQVYRVCLALMVLTIVLSIPWSKAHRSISLLGLVCVAGYAVSIHTLQAWSPYALSASMFRHQSPSAESYLGPEAAYAARMSRSTVRAYRDGPNTSVAIRDAALDEKVGELLFDTGDAVARSILVNGKSDGETSLTDMETMRLAGHLPMLLSRDVVENAAVVGFGLGVTIGTLTLYPELKDIHAIEISPVVHEFAHYFDFANHGVTKNPKVRWSIDDAYRVLGGGKEHYSLIVSEPSNPWVTGVERVFASEFYDIVRKKLKPGGVYAQWVQLYSISDATLELVFATFSQKFPHVRVFEANYDMILLGSETPFGEEALAHLETRYYNLPEVRRSLEGVGITTPEGLLAREVWLPLEKYSREATHTLARPRLAYAAGRDFFQNTHVKLEEYLGEQEHRPWRRRAGNRALIGQWLARGHNKPEILKDYTAAVCKQSEAAYFPGWVRSSHRCQESLVALEVLGIIKSDPEGASPEVIEWLRAMVEIPGEEDPQSFNSILAQLDVAGVEQMISLFSQYDSPFLPLSVRRLLLAGVTCFKEQTPSGRWCQVRLVEALARSGYGQVAQAVLEKLRENFDVAMAAQVEESLQPLVQSALTAEQKLSELH